MKPADAVNRGFVVAAVAALSIGAAGQRDTRVAAPDLLACADHEVAQAVAEGAPGAETHTDDAPQRVEPTTCTYRTYQWSTEEGRAVNRRTVEHPYDEVVDDERSPEDPRCTVCSEDQVEIDLQALGIDEEPILVCWVYRDRIEAALRTAAESGEFRFEEVTGYRPGRTRGRVVDGMRTEWSNHSFGTAIDINADQNGLYRSCDVDQVTPETIDDCRLGMGGRWDPEGDPSRSITRDGVVYREFIETVGWRWGGEISGRTRDLMHFSLTGE